MSRRSTSGSSRVSLAAMAAAQLRAFQRSRAQAQLQRAAPLIPHRPTPEQWEFLALSCEEAFYGGAAGGGKTDALIMAALQFADVPGYAAAIFRRTKVEHEQPEAPLARAKLWFAPAIAAGRCRFDGKASFYFHTRDGEAPSVLHFGYLANEQDRTRYVGAAFQFIGVDEITWWSESNYRWLFSRCRGPKTWRGVVPNRVRATGNPGGPGHRWVKARFVEKAKHVTTGRDLREDLDARRRRGVPLVSPRVYESPPSEDAVKLAAEFGLKAQGAFYVPAFATDNPHLDLYDYRSKLMKQSPVEREWLEWGNWDAEATGGFFRPEHFEVVDALPPCDSWIRGWDFAATEMTAGTDPDWTAGVKIGKHTPPTGVAGGFRLMVGDVVRFREEPGVTTRRTVATVQADGHDTLQVLEQEGGSAGKRDATSWATTSLFGWRVEFERRTGSKATYLKPISNLVEFAPMLVKRAEWTEAFINELIAFPVGHDDQADGLSTAYTRVPKVEIFLV